MNPPRWADLTADQVKQVSNGCGPKGISWIIPDLVFNCPCSRHDFDYWLGCTEDDRKAADDLLLKGMLEHAKTQKTWMSRRFYTFAAWRYYYAVRWFGAKAFYFGPSQRTLEDDLAL